MPVSNPLALASNGLLLLTLALYTIAIAAYAGDFAFGRRSPATAPGGKAVRLPAAASALAGPASAPGRPDAGHATPRRHLSAAAATPADRIIGVRPGADDDIGNTPPGTAGRWPRSAWLQAAFSLTCAGLAAHAAAILTRGIAEHRLPWGNMYEFITAITSMAVLALVATALRHQAWYLGLFVLLPVVLALAAAITVIYAPPGAVVPPLQSYWIAIHVTSMIIASGFYTLGVITTVMYLAAGRLARRPAAGRPAAVSAVLARLPRPFVLDQLSYRAIVVAFPAWTFGIMAGAMWADQAWGRYWGWDPKETWSFITWVVYAAFLHARTTSGWGRRKAAVIHLAGYGCLLFNLIGVNLWVPGLHSYAGI